MEISKRAVELLNLPDDEPAFILDVGCGSGLSGGDNVLRDDVGVPVYISHGFRFAEVLEEAGHSWVGIDVRYGSDAMTSLTSLHCIA